LCLKYTDFGSCEQLKTGIINKAIDDVFSPEKIATESDFNNRLESGKEELYENVMQWSRLISDVLGEYREIKKVLKKADMSRLDIVADIKLQLDNLFPDDFITVIESEWLRQYPRYLTGIKKRYEKAINNPVRDRSLRLEFSGLWDEYIKRRDAMHKQHLESEQLGHYRWMLEEYRISLFSQEMKTRFPVSAKRLKKYRDDFLNA
jgi:ATP-dependent helicase HrpA